MKWRGLRQAADAAPATCVVSAQRGLSLIELIVFIVIVSVALAGLLSVFNIGAKASADPMIRKQALTAAEGMLEEVLSKNYENDAADPGNTDATLGCTLNTTAPPCRPNTVLDRANYNDIDDYQNWDQGVIQLDGNPAPILGTYRVRVTVAASALGGLAGKQVTVSVSGGGETIVVSGFRAPI